MTNSKQRKHRSMLEGLQAQGLRAPKLVISDGHKGLTKALEKWPGYRLQRCTALLHGPEQIADLPDAGS